jgi:hypothetical protein
MAASAMQQQTTQFKAPRQAPPPPPPIVRQTSPSPMPRQQQPPREDPLSGLMSFLGGTNPPPRPDIKPIPEAPKEIKPPSSMGISDILKSIQREEKKITTPVSQPVQQSMPKLKSALKKSGSSDARKSSKNSVVIKL